MGTIHHHAIVVTGWDDSLDKAHKAASEIFRWVSPISPEVTNGYRSFFIPPDGSKEWWNESEEGNTRRLAFMRLLEVNQDWYVEAVEVGYGELGYTCRVPSEVLEQKSEPH
jgi:hypothetical protein